MTEPPLFSSAAGMGPSPQGDTPPLQSPPPPALTGEPASLDVPPLPPVIDWGTIGAPTAYPTTEDPFVFPIASGPDPGPQTPGGAPAGWIGPGGPATPTMRRSAGPRPAPSGGSRIVVVTFALVLGLVAAGAAARFAGLGTDGPTFEPVFLPPQPVETPTEITPFPTQNDLVFIDDFSDPGSGWTTSTLPSGTTFEYADGGYVVVARGSLDHLASAPYDTPREQITASVTAVQSSGAPLGAGFGVTCDRGSGAAEIRYRFLLTVDTWYLEREDGPLSATDKTPVILKQGDNTLAIDDPAYPVTVEGTCASDSDRRTTRLTLVIGGANLAQVTDTATALPGDGWLAELIVSSEASAPSTVTVSGFEVRDLAR